MKIKGKPVTNAPDRIGNYQFGDNSSPALCEQLRHMQKDMSSTKRAIVDLLETNKQVLESMQDQQRAVDILINRVDRASSNGDTAVTKMAESADTMALNTDMIVKATLLLARAMADEETYQEALIKATEEMKVWKKESKELSSQSHLKVVSERE